MSAAASSSSAGRAAPRWGDFDDNDNDDAPLASPLAGAAAPAGGFGPVPVVSSKVDAKGIKTVVEFGTNAAGEKIKITRKLKVTTKPVRMNRHVLERQNWEKFGDCKGLPRGPEQNVTYQSFEIIHLDLKPKKREEEKEESSLDKLAGASSIVVCRNCGETGHWTLKCPKRQAIKVNMPGDNGSGPDDMRGDGPSSSTAAGGKYVPVHMRAGADARPVAAIGRPEDAYALRISNLSEDVTEDDLYELVNKVGRTTRIYLVRDKVTQQSRGFAFVNYGTRQDAERAIARLNGHGYANLILRVEYAKPREERPQQQE